MKNYKNIRSLLTPTPVHTSGCPSVVGGLLSQFQKSTPKNNFFGHGFEIVNQSTIESILDTQYNHILAVLNGKWYEVKKKKL